MRDIKFRAWDKRDSRFMDTVMVGNMLYELHVNKEADVFEHFILMQYTGLKDKNGKEIYEGDIVRTYMGNICEIRWDFVSESSEHQDFEYTGFCFHHLEQSMNYHLDITSSCEIIGDIYRNPYLLKP